MDISVEGAVQAVLAQRQEALRDQVRLLVLKKELAETLVDMYHPQGSGKVAREEFERVFSQKQVPDDMPQLSIEQLKAHEIDPSKIYLVHLMSKSGLAKSNSEARKLIQAGGVSLNSDKITDVDYEFELKQDIILKVGKRRFLKLHAE